jgi:hypothetical protein
MIRSSLRRVVVPYHANTSRTIITAPQSFKLQKKQKIIIFFLSLTQIALAQTRSFATTPIAPLEPATSLETTYGHFERRLKAFRAHHKKPLTLAEKGMR